MNWSSVTFHLCNVFFQTFKHVIRTNPPTPYHIRNNNIEAIPTMMTTNTTETLLIFYLIEFSLAFSVWFVFVCVRASMALHCRATTIILIFLHDFKLSSFLFGWLSTPIYVCIMQSFPTIFASIVITKSNSLHRFFMNYMLNTPSNSCAFYNVNSGVNAFYMNN